MGNASPVTTKEDQGKAGLAITISVKGVLRTIRKLLKRQSIVLAINIRVSVTMRSLVTNFFSRDFIKAKID